MSESTEIIFIVGNSRSGTTMLANVLGRHPEVFSFHELHFFEQVWVPVSKIKNVDREYAKKICATLIHRQRIGLRAKHDLKKFAVESHNLVNQLKDCDLKPPILFKHFLQTEVKHNNKNIPCEQTPRNIFFVKDILVQYPEARIINLVRDPRDVLLSQKYRWKRRSMGNKGIPFKEVIRFKLNYHPYIISRIWKSCAILARKYDAIDRFYSAKFENLVLNPTKEVEKICKFLGISFNDEMLKVEHLSSSFRKSGEGRKGINKSPLFRWKKGGLQEPEIKICQDLNWQLMEYFGYELKEKMTSNRIKVIGLYLILPLQLFLAFFLNFSRYRNIIGSIARRLRS